MCGFPGVRSCIDESLGAADKLDVKLLRASVCVCFFSVRVRGGGGGEIEKGKGGVIQVRASVSVVVRVRHTRNLIEV